MKNSRAKFPTFLFAILATLVLSVQGSAATTPPLRCTIHRLPNQSLALSTTRRQNLFTMPYKNSSQFKSAHAKLLSMGWTLLDSGGACTILQDQSDVHYKTYVIQNHSVKELHPLAPRVAVAKSRAKVIAKPQVRAAQHRRSARARVAPGYTQHRVYKLVRSINRQFGRAYRPHREIATAASAAFAIQSASGLRPLPAKYDNTRDLNRLSLEGRLVPTSHGLELRPAVAKASGPSVQ